MQLFYHPELNPDSPELIFAKEESRHVVRVLRKSVGDRLHTTNGKGLLATVQIVEAAPNRCIAKIVEATQSPSLPYRLHLAVAPTKQNERYEWFLEKATELGITEITPLICDHSERKKINHERYAKIVLSAMKQSLQTYLPHLHPASNFRDFVNRHKNSPSQKLIAHCAEGEKQNLPVLLKPKTDTLILIGPEGDFSIGEIESALHDNYCTISLGNTRLRTETAAVAACHSVSFVNL